MAFHGKYKPKTKKKKTKTTNELATFAGGLGGALQSGDGSNRHGF